MSKRLTRTFSHYHFGKRGVLVPGDWFRVSGGPYYESPSGEREAFTDTGPFCFECYCEQGAKKWIEARSWEGTYCVLWMGRRMRSELDSRIVRRPYKITSKTTAEAEKQRRERQSLRRKVALVKSAIKGKA